MAEGNQNPTGENHSNQGVLKFKPGEEYKIKIEKQEEFGESLFKNIYKRAAKNLAGIVRENKDNGATNPEDELFFKDSYNNIIAFTGERGTGKSSCMISFSEAIKDFDKEKLEGVFRQEDIDIIKDCCFQEIGVIDPSMFEEKDNILEIIIAKMFSRFNREIKRSKSDMNYKGKRELLMAFQAVYENLKTIQKEKHERLDGEIIEALSNLASGSNLKSSIVKLVDKYLQFMGSKDNKTFFLLVIDDFDLNIKHAGEMAEQIRKYLVIPGIIILMAVKLDQLTGIIEQSYREKFEIMLREKVHRMPFDEPQNMASRYLEKLIPEDRRRYLPEIRKIENKDINIKVEDMDGSKTPSASTSTYRTGTNYPGNWAKIFLPPRSWPIEMSKP